MASDFNKKLNISKIEKKEIHNQKYIPENGKETNKNNPKINISISNLISNKNNNQINTPLKNDSESFNYIKKTKLNFQEKSTIENTSDSEFKFRCNSISMRSPIFSYFNESQKFLNDKYNEKNFKSLTEKNR